MTQPLPLENHRWSPAQRRIIDLLSDGEPHKMEDLIAALDDPAATIESVHGLFSSIRPILRIYGHDIICQRIHRWYFYRHIRTL